MTSSSSPDLRRRGSALISCLLLANLAAWGWAFALYGDRPVMMGTALLAWGLGLRHAVDADHIAAIDNVTRKLMQDGQRPLSVGLWFAIGHSAIVLVAALGLAYAVSALAGLDRFRAAGGVAATLISASFLFAIAIMNLLILRRVVATFRRVRAGGRYAEADLDMLTGGRGPLSRLFRPLFRLIGRPWQMALLGFLFGLGFDTATEVAILGLSASQASGGFALAHVLVLPLLFAAGMALVDTVDGMLMMGAYQWAFVNPLRKLYYNIVITALSAAVAIGIGTIETLALLGEKLGLTGGVWDVAAALGAHFNDLGFLIIGLFIACWIASALFYRWKGYDAIELAPVEQPLPM